MWCSAGVCQFSLASSLPERLDEKVAYFGFSGTQCGAHRQAVSGGRFLLGPAEVVGAKTTVEVSTVAEILVS